MSQFKPHRETLKIVARTNSVSQSLCYLAASLASEMAPLTAIVDAQQDAIAQTEKLAKQCRLLLRKLKAARVVTEGAA